ncbi:alpha/beta hydrolase [Trinickia fusca]|uniref:Alpha/beta hydrolase n=1 Tax=Trinickia fusca TaxID=2419777 RepID=A0A494XNB9_9BURK|nr:alpha/beta hydrolase [Trinickia fusca]
MLEEHFTPAAVRLRLCKSQPGPFNWLLLPGGPGIGSESLAGLAACLDVPGAIWLVDLPGDGSNVALPPADECYRHWPKVLLEAAQALPNCIYVGHSTGGMYLLSVPELEDHICGLVLISSAPDAGWRERFGEMVSDNPLPAVESASHRFETCRSNETLRELTLAAAEWNFTPDGLAAGRRLLATLPFNLAAVDWSESNFEAQYTAKWWPRATPVLILSGSEDRIVAQNCWESSHFRDKNVTWTKIDCAGHFPWVEQPSAVAAAFSDLARVILERHSKTDEEHKKAS